MLNAKLCTGPPLLSSPFSPGAVCMKPPPPDCAGPAWRGLQAPWAYDAYRGLRARGIQGYFTWSLEDSAKRGFDIEAALQAMP